MHEQAQTSLSLRKTEFYKYVIKVIKTNVLDKKYYSDLSTGVSKLTAYSVIRLVSIGKERCLTAVVAGCSSAWQNKSGKAGLKKGTVARAGPEVSHLQESCSGLEAVVEKYQFGFAPLMNAQVP